MTKDIETYFIDGCGRCSLFGTPACKVNTYRKELKLLRQLVLDCGLTENIKWGQPCYTHNGNNVLLVTCFKEFACISFFKGALLNDANNILTAPGENSQAIRQIKFTDPKQVVAQEAIIKAYIYEAIEIDKAGLKIAFKKNREPVPEELQEMLDKDTKLKAAFEALTPGKQRGYILHFSAPKQAKTRISRIEKCIPKIMAGRGFHDR